MLLMVETCIREVEYALLFIDMQMLNKYMKNHDKIKESSSLKHWDVNRLYGYAIFRSYL